MGSHIRLSLTDASNVTNVNRADLYFLVDMTCNRTYMAGTKEKLRLNNCISMEQINQVMNLFLMQESVICEISHLILSKIIL